jgi:hypothetical protein
MIDERTNIRNIIFVFLQVIFELHDPNPELTIDFVTDPDFTCGPNQ